MTRDPEATAMELIERSDIQRIWIADELAGALDSIQSDAEEIWREHDGCCGEVVNLAENILSALGSVRKAAPPPSNEEELLKRARELLADEEDRQGFHTRAQWLRDGAPEGTGFKPFDYEDARFRAIVAALRTPTAIDERGLIVAALRGNSLFFGMNKHQIADAIEAGAHRVEGDRT